MIHVQNLEELLTLSGGMTWLLFCIDVEILCLINLAWGEKQCLLSRPATLLNRPWTHFLRLSKFFVCNGKGYLAGDCFIVLELSFTEHSSPRDLYNLYFLCGYICMNQIVFFIVFKLCSSHPNKCEPAISTNCQFIMVPV